MLDYIRDGNEIYRKSFATIRAEADLTSLPEDLQVVAVRLIHSCGMTDIVKDLDYSENVVKIAREALKNGANILCDAQMVANGVTRKRLPANNAVICTLNESDVPELAKQMGNTRSAAAMELWRSPNNQSPNKSLIGGSLIAIGNAPTALFRLLEILDEMMDQDLPKPAAILGFPVGFVGAIESKAALAANSRGVPFLTIHGRRGGSAMCAAALNALAMENEL
jgi:precorrin isomerase